MLLEALEVLGVASVALAGAAMIVLALEHRLRSGPSTGTAQPDGRAVLLFEQGTLVDATPGAQRLLQQTARVGSDLSRLATALARGFGPDLEQRLAGLPRFGRLVLASPHGAGTLEIADEGRALRVTLAPDATAGSAVDLLALRAAEAELDLLRGLAEAAPQPIWMMDERGGLAWANQAYLALADRAAGLPEGAATAAWPAQPLFPVPADLAEGERRLQRLSLPAPPDGEPSWHDVTSLRRGEGSLHFATDVGDLVRAEAARRQFVQTLAKTFAHLRTGLAIFDRDRRLVLFNPAFVDLTSLPIGFLSGRPLVRTVLDRLRDAKILPEPRDYAGWRETVAALEAAAAEGHYHETWTLPDGRTYRVTGRPHLDGALAFLFEDISDEIGLTRRFRADLGMAQAALDALEDAVAVFSPTGVISLSNVAYARLWGLADDERTAPSLLTELARWEERSVSSPIWNRLRDGWNAGRLEATGTLELHDGRDIFIRALPLARCGTLVSFRPAPTSPPDDLPAMPSSS
ncbi:PAS-domain containing protein [Rubellimicrobium roseum]|uniref:PAS domain-containing protein n=1 Tax=Rubellimicrobium roseum TaxID=687525 RepID=A0A5C4NJM8_9RHOB|nr:PAS-domain containing protein [Rubellimicrobium roseum]TNC74322.1 PAS domain-containing protein [Rubellimicrobium roseum]